MGVVYHFNFYNSLMLAGIIQGIIFGIVVLGAKKYRVLSTRLLAAFILSFSFDNLQYYLEDAGFISEAEFWTIWFVPFQLLSGILFLGYGLRLIEPDRPLDKREFWLLTPFLTALVLAIVYKTAYALDPQNTALWSLPDVAEPVLEYTSIAIDFSVVVYLFTRIRETEKSNKELADRLRWFKRVIVALFLLSLVWLLVALADYQFGLNYWYAVYIGMAMAIYWMGHVGIYKFGVEQEKRKNKPLTEPNADSDSKTKNEHIAALENLLVAQRRFLDPMLTLDKVAEELKISKSHLSRTINAELGIGFPDYLNALRVAEAKAYLHDPQFANYTLVAIGLEAGFNSKTTFNAAFKKATSLTPSEYRKTQIGSNS
ncbi:helix-turn-helix domain-containing protein [Flavobacterium caeni]|uniref:Helix-turn-helix domain-containing protein n=1 Tax=Flavobacterium caeni TaxID=490189 RepID=A0A1G5HTT1_9FLAO|nr:helix-turn-helix transcriptional regulator [Flavobacterium caeni]SCY67275.1 Helix-turn-helix domain-containing protein [Flavobacterium caeni]